MSGKGDSVDSIKLIPLADFDKVADRVFSTTKAESDRQLAKFQSANSARRKRKARRAK